MCKSGSILQEYCEVIGVFEKKRKHKTCYNFMRLIDCGSIKKAASSTNIIISPNSPPPALLPQQIRRPRRIEKLLKTPTPRDTRSKRGKKRRKRIEGTFGIG